MKIQATKIKSVLYCRVSSREQEETGYSLDSQEKLLKEYAERNNLEAAKVFKISESASGKQVRKTFNEMLDCAKKHNIPIILCEKIDRLTRNLKDAAIISDWIAENDKRELHFVKESFVVNKNTRAHENLVWDMKVAIARFYTNNLSEEVKKGQKEKLAQGWLPTKPPLGYKTIGEKGHKIHVIDETKAPFMKRMFELYATGNYSITAILNTLNKEGLKNRIGKKVCRSRIYDLLSDPFYYGKMKWKTEIYDGEHEPLISKELFDMVQINLNRKTTDSPQYRKHLPIFKAKIKCEKCNGTITWEIQRGHWYGHHSNYGKAKNCPHRLYLRQEAVEEQLFPYLVEKVVPKSERVLKWLEKALKESHKEEIDYNTNKREELMRIIQAADRRIEMAYRDKLDGRILTALCEKVISESTKEKEETLEALNKLTESRAAYYEAGFAIHELALKAKDIYQNLKATPEERRLLLSYAFSNISLKADEIKPKYTLAFEFLAEWMPKVNKVFEQAENRSDKRKEDTFVSSCPAMLRG